MLADVDGLGLHPVCEERALRPVDGADGAQPATDALVELRFAGAGYPAAQGDPAAARRSATARRMEATVSTTNTRPQALLGAAGRGAVAGLLGVAVMTAAEKLEQAVTHRPNSYVPGRALLTLLGRHPSDDVRSFWWNHAMHWGTGAVLGALRGVWAAIGLRGPRADSAHTIVRLATDQTVENATGVGAPPHTWPVREQVVDVLHKAIYSFATGVFADRLVPPRLESRRGTTSH